MIHSIFLWKEGRPDGCWRSWSQFGKGKLIAEGNFKNGQRDGRWRFWAEDHLVSHQSNDLIYDRKYIKDVLVSEKCWDLFGSTTSCEKYPIWDPASFWKKNPFLLNF